MDKSSRSSALAHNILELRRAKAQLQNPPIAAQLFLIFPQINLESSAVLGSHCVAEVPSVVANRVVSPMSDCGGLVSFSFSVNLKSKI